MKLTKKEMEFAVKTYEDVRYAKRGLMFKKSKKKRKDPSKIKGVVDFYEFGNAQAAHVKKGKLNIIMTMGSNELLDWIMDFSISFKKVPYKKPDQKSKVRVHNGFLKSYMNMRGWVHEIVKGLEDGDKLLIQGHSMGAAMSTLMAIDIDYNFPGKLKTDVILTGSPRVGNKHFVESYNKRVGAITTRFVYKSDLVPLVPFKFLGFKHVVTETHLGKKRIMFSILNHIMRKGYNNVLVAGYAEAKTNKKRDSNGSKS